MPIPYRINTARLLLRCWSPDDAPQVLAAIEASLEHLRRWMAWARKEPEPLPRKALRLKRWRRELERGRHFIYGIFDPKETAVLGGIGLHRRIGAGAGEIGYWIHVGNINRGLCTEAAAAVTRIAFEVLSLSRMEIHCDPRNAASAAIPRKLGYTLQVTVPGRVLRPSDPPRDTMIWTLLRADYPASPASRVPVEAVDESGNRLL